MAKKKGKYDPKGDTPGRITRTEAYANKVRLMFSTTVNQILAMNKTLPTLQPGEMFSFDGQSKKKQQEVERLLRQLHSVATMAIQQGITLEWGMANQAADRLVSSVFGQEALSTPEFSAWCQRNNGAMNAFINRSEKGMNLSDRVWKSVKQLREEMEVAITVSVGEGQSAQDMSKRVRGYLQDPDLMFRRFRYKVRDEEILDEDGNVIDTKPIYGRKWKKRIKKPDGTYGWIDYDRDSYKTGAGVYKSSYKNAMRLTRTETNIAYRRADRERWQQMDFVLGQRVQMSSSHPRKDICDKLQGDYPKDFVFDGWHPQCFCFVTPITIPPEETEKLTDMMLNGEDWRSELARMKRGREITSYPENFKQWVRDNSEKIVNAHDYGEDPYFIRNNYAAVDDILHPDRKKKLTPQQRADKRHADRTPEQEEAIRNRWKEHKEKMEAEKKSSHTYQVAKKYGNNILRVMEGIPDVDTTALKEAIKSGDYTRIQQEAQALRATGKQFKADAHKALGTAADYGEVSSDKLDAAIRAGNIRQIWQETKALQNRIKLVQQDETDLETIIPGAHEWHKQYTSEQLHIVVDNVKRTLSKMPTDLAARKAELEFEIKWVEDNKRHETWKVAQDAYKKELAAVNRQIDEQAIQSSVATALAYVTSDADYLKLVTEMRAILSTPNYSIATAQAKAAELNKKLQEIKPWTSSKPKETLAELRKRLGEDTPATLKNAKPRKSHGWDEDEENKFRENMLELFDNSDFGMNVPRLSKNGDDVIDALFDSHFKNQMETKTGKGCVNINYRKQASNELFGTDLSTTADPDYEKYGFLMDKDILAQASSGIAGQYWSYGDGIQIRFDKSKVIATFTMEDSLGSGLKPSLTTDPKSSSTSDSSVIRSGKKTSAIEATREWACSYIELQYHGDLTLDCIQSIYIPADVIPKIKPETIKKMLAVGKPIYTTDSAGKLIQYTGK